MFLFSCSRQNTTNLGIENSNINNLTFKDINNIKEYKVCSETSGISSNDDYAGSGVIGFYLLPFFLIADYLKSYRNHYEPYNMDEMYDSAKYSLGSGDVSISKAVKLGGINKIKMIDHSYEMTGLFRREYCIIVYGE